ncbi:MAG: diguanylate cyclase [Xanthomonadales bacterium]|nr:diguanylate cyclase [Xanthomonadales bacterium]
MTPLRQTPSIEAQSAEAQRTLAGLKAQSNEVRAEVKEARAHLAELNLEVEAAENRLENSNSEQLLEANQNLLLSTLRAQEDADLCAESLKIVSEAASLDTLTELPNRELLLDRFKHAIAMARRKGEHLALLFVDMNHFKAINDTLGHAVGDQVLQRAARCLSSAVREVDTVSRHGGDEFLILLPDIQHPSDTVLVARKVGSALGMPFRIGDHILRLTASIGICVYPDDGDTPEVLIDRADAAMYRAKRLGLGSFALHQAGTEDEAASQPAPVVPLQQPIIHYDAVMAEYEQHAEQLREANEQLVLAALNAQALQAAAELSQQRQKEFLALVAHELRNPMTPLGVAASLLGSSNPLDLKRMQLIVEQQITHISRLVGDLLDLSRSSTGKLRLHFHAIDLAKVIDDAINVSRPAMDARLQHFRVDLPLQPVALEADAIRLNQILSNLLDNASKYTPDGGEISLVVHTHKDEVVIHVRDNGIGISQGALPRVFEPFAQDSHATGFNGQGLGIGLTVVKELVEAHDGTVVVASDGIGLGSEFVVTLPLNVFREEDTAS